MKFIKIFVAALAIFALQFTVASAASAVEKPGIFVSANQQVHQEHKHHITRHHYSHRPHRLHRK